MFRRGFCVLLITLPLLTGALAARADERGAAQAASKEWLDKLDAGDYRSTWQSAASLFKAALSEQVWQQAASTARAPLGAVRGRTEVSAVRTKTLPGVPDGDYVVLQFNTTFENKSQAVETVATMLEKDGTWKVAGYFVR